MVAISALTSADRVRLGRRARLLAGASITYNVVKAIIAIGAGLVAGRSRSSASVWTRWWRYPAGSSFCGSSGTPCLRPVSNRRLSTHSGGTSEAPMRSLSVRRAAFIGVGPWSAAEP